jgi:hypothetical protein
MSMTKAERERMAKLEEETRIARALSWSNATLAPMIPPPSGSGETSGWVWNMHSETVSQAWSRAVCHGSGAKSDPGRVASQRGIALCPTRLDALLRLRAGMERQFAIALARIDAQIAAEREGGAS